MMDVWEVLGKRAPDDEWAVVGGVKAPDADMALMLAKETHFRHKEGVAYAVRRRGDTTLHQGTYRADLLGGVTDHSYRRQEAYTGVGARHKKLAAEFEKRGMRIDRPRPTGAGATPGGRRRTEEARRAAGEAEPSMTDVSPEDLAAHGTAG
jgi:1,2-phenylacetyl-CoA epoxidase PaaB subunit